MAFAAEHSRNAQESKDPKSSESKTDKPEDEDFSESPFTEYGEFNESTIEEADTKFFQYGRFFGVSLGLGFDAVDGNRGGLYQGGFPMFDLKVHYWFDFNLALDLGFFTAVHYYNTTAQNYGNVGVNIMRAGLDVMYYFETKNVGSTISFANPFILIGAGAFSKNQYYYVQQTTDSDTAMGISLGAGLEFAISPRKTYFQIEGKIHIIPFKDNTTTLFQSVGLANLSGNFYTISGNILFTW